MRNGDCYKLQSMAKQGVSDSDIIHYFRNKYDAAEVMRFILPVKPKPEPKPEPQATAKVRTLAKRRARAKTPTTE